MFLVKLSVEWHEGHRSLLQFTFSDSEDIRSFIELEIEIESVADYRYIIR